MSSQHSYNIKPKKPAYGDDSSLSALTFIPPVTLQRVSLPDKSVT